MVASSAAQESFHVVIERGEDGYYVASVVELPGCHTQAKSIKELDKRIKEAIEVYLESEGPERPAIEFVAIKQIRI